MPNEYDYSNWEWEDVESDDAYADLEDILYDLLGDRFDMSKMFYSDEDMDTFGYGAGEADESSYWNMYLKDFYEYDEETGQFISKYDPAAFEKAERGQLDIQLGNITTDIEGQMTKYRAGTGRGLTPTDFDISEIANMAKTDADKSALQYTSARRESEMTWLEDALESIESSITEGDFGWLDDDLDD